MLTSSGSSEVITSSHHADGTSSDAASSAQPAQAVPWMAVTEGADTFFYNSVTGESTWALPEGFTQDSSGAVVATAAQGPRPSASLIAQAVASAAPPHASSQAEGSSTQFVDDAALVPSTTWSVVKEAANEDGVSPVQYYYNSATGESTWSLPLGCVDRGDGVVYEVPDSSRVSSEAETDPSSKGQHGKGAEATLTSSSSLPSASSSSNGDGAAHHQASGSRVSSSAGDGMQQSGGGSLTTLSGSSAGGEVHVTAVPSHITASSARDALQGTQHGEVEASGTTGDGSQFSTLAHESAASSGYEQGGGAAVGSGVAAVLSSSPRPDSSNSKEWREEYEITKLWSVIRIDET